MNGRGRRTRVIVVRQILELLERDATLTPETLATMTDQPVEEVRAQIAAWERSGAIRRYRAVVDWDAVDDDPTRETVTAFIDVSITPARGVGFDDVAGRIARFDEVRSVYLVSGQPGPALHGHRPDASARCRTSSPRSSRRSTGCAPPPPTSSSRPTSATATRSGRPSPTTGCR